jgi:hypothetical protein
MSLTQTEVFEKTTRLIERALDVQSSGSLELQKHELIQIVTSLGVLYDEFYPMYTLELLERVHAIFFALNEVLSEEHEREQWRYVNKRLLAASMLVHVQKLRRQRQKSASAEPLNTRN